MHDKRRGRPQVDPETEILSRVRRIETRVTQMMVAQGIHTEAQKPSFSLPQVPGDPALLVAPSRHSTLQEILDSIPPDWQGSVRVSVGTTGVLTVERAEPSA